MTAADENMPDGDDGRRRVVRPLPAHFPWGAVTVEKNERGEKVVRFPSPPPGLKADLYWGPEWTWDGSDEACV